MDQFWNDIFNKAMETNTKEIEVHPDNKDGYYEIKTIASHEVKTQQVKDTQAKDFMKFLKDKSNSKQDFENKIEDFDGLVEAVQSIGKKRLSKLLDEQEADGIATFGDDWVY